MALAIMTRHVILHAGSLDHGNFTSTSHPIRNAVGTTNTILSLPTA